MEKSNSLDKEFKGSLKNKEALNPASPEIEAYKTQLHETIIGQDNAVEDMAELYNNLMLGIKRSSLGPLAVRFLAGPSGVGKTELVYAFARMFYENQQNRQSAGNIKKLAQQSVIKINGGEFGHSHEVAKLLGSPPGYIGHDISSPFSNESIEKHKIIFMDKRGQIRNITIILMDEADKFDKSVHQAMLSVLDKGQLVNGSNEIVDFRNTVIFYTSNAGNKEAEDSLKSDNNKIGFRKTVTADQKNKDQNSAVQKSKIEEIYKEAFIKGLSPEFRGRVNDITYFEHLSREQVKAIAFKLLREFEQDRTYAKAQAIPTRIACAFCSYQLTPVFSRLNSSFRKATKHAKMCVN